ncbi:MAG TPA: M18 family aminopeptidase [Propionibacteriaceae bacterium]
MDSAAREHLDDLAQFVVASPSSFHAAAEGARRLAAAGFVEQDETQPWDNSPGGHYLVRAGALLGWRVPDGAAAVTPLRIIGSHTDSPTFSLKPRPDLGIVGWQQLGVEIYGGPLLNSWLDRDLGLAGMLALADGTTRLVRTGAVMRIPQLAIHLDRGVNDDGLKLDRQAHTAPVWSVGHPEASILDHLAELAGCGRDDVDGYDVLAFDTAAPTVFGAREEFFASGRLDNLGSVHASLVALIGSTGSARIEMLAAFDHEELGSGSRTGAAGPILADVVARILGGLGATADEQHRALARSVCLSADAGHAVHPNYVGRHDPANRPLPNGGPLLKLNANQRYATDARGAAMWRRACRSAGIQTQEFVSSNALPCGSTIGPLTATRLGIATLDVGLPLLSMHSVRELAGAEDPLALSLAMGAFLALDA